MRDVEYLGVTGSERSVPDLNEFEHIDEAIMTKTHPSAPQSALLLG